MVVFELINCPVSEHAYTAVLTSMSLCFVQFISRRKGGTFVVGLDAAARSLNHSRKTGILVHFVITLSILRRTLLSQPIYLLSHRSLIVFLRFSPTFYLHFITFLRYYYYILYYARRQHNRSTFADFMGKNRRSSSAFTLLVGRQEGHPVCKNDCWYSAGDDGDFTGALHFLGFPTVNATNKLHLLNVI